MKKSKRVIAFLMAMSVIGMNAPMTMGADRGIVAFAVQGDIQITQQPKNVPAEIGAQATFKVVASGVKAYQWEYYTGTKWASITNWTGYDTDTLTVPSVTEVRRGYTYRCKLTGNTGNIVYTDEVKITDPNVAVNITTQPVSVAAQIGAQATFKVTASRVKAYQWEYYNGTKWASITNWTGYNTDTLTVPKVTEARRGYTYRCKLTGNTGDVVYTDEVKITDPNAAVNITTQPVSVAAEIGAQATFKVAASGVAAYQWEYYTGTKWASITNWTGYNTDTLTVPKVTEARRGYTYRCKLTGNNGNTIYTNEVKITEPVAPIKITSQPVSVVAANGAQATFKVTASGVAKYQWQFNNGSKWQDINNWNGYNAATLTVPSVTEARRGFTYRCKLTGNNGDTVYTDEVKLLIPNAVIPTGNTEIAVTVNEPYQLDLVGNGLTYYSTQKWLKVDKNGVVTASQTGPAYVFVTDKSGHSFRYKVNSLAAHTPLAFDAESYTIDPQTNLRLRINGEASYMCTDENNVTISAGSDSTGNYFDFNAYFPGEYQVLAYNDLGESDVAYVKVNGSIVDAKIATEYKGDLDLNNSVWYRYENDTDSSVKVTFDVTGVPDNDEGIIGASYDVYYFKGDHNLESVHRYGEYLENVSVNLKAGDSVYVVPVSSNDNMVNKYDFTINTEEQDVKVLELDAPYLGSYVDVDSYDVFMFTASETGVYVFESDSESDMYGELYSDPELTHLIAEGDDIEYDDYTDYNFRIKYSLSEGQTVYLKPRNCDENESADYNIWVTQTVQYEDLQLDIPTSGHCFDEYSYDVFKFTAPKAGTYVFESASEYNSMYGALYSDASLYNRIESDAGTGHFRIEYSLSAGQTVYLKPEILFSSDEVKNYKVIVTEKVPFNVLILDFTKSGEYRSNSDYDVFKFTAPETGVYSFTSSNIASNSRVWASLYSDAECKNSLSYSNEVDGFRIEYSISAGQTVYLAPRSYYGAKNIKYSVTVTKLDVPAFEPQNVTEEYLYEGSYVEASLNKGDNWFLIIDADEYYITDISRTSVGVGDSSNNTHGSNSNCRIYIYTTEGKYIRLSTEDSYDYLKPDYGDFDGDYGFSYYVLVQSNGDNDDHVYFHYEAMDYGDEG